MTFSVGHSCKVGDFKLEGLTLALLAALLKEFITLGPVDIQSGNII